MDLARRHDLRILLCTPTAAPPVWLLRRHPQVWLIDQHGRPHPGGRHMICYNDPTARRLAERIVVELVSRYKDDPALLGWQIDNEPTVGESASSSRFYDFHPETKKLFRAHLKDQYADLDRLNAAWVNSFWSSSYDCWESIEPPTAVGGNPGLWLAWTRFRDRNTADLIAWQRDIIRARDSVSPIGTNIPETGPVRSAMFGQDYWAQAEGLDFVGLDIYCYQGDPERELRDIGYSCDVIRSAAESAGAEFWIAETQAGPHRRPWKMSFAGGVWGPDFLRRSTRSFAQRGAQKILYFLWRPVLNGHEFGMNGMVHADGSPSPISLAVADVLKESRNEVVRICESDRPVFVHYSRDSLLMGRGFDSLDTAGSSLCGWHELLEDLGFAVTFVSDTDLVTGRVPSEAPLILPYTLVLTEPLAGALAARSKATASVAYGYATGFFDEVGSCCRVTPGYRLDQVCGISTEAFDHVEPSSKLVVQADPPFSVSDVMVAYVREFCGAEVVARDAGGRPAAARHGRSVTFLFDLGTAYRSADAAERDALRRFYSEAMQLS